MMPVDVMTTPLPAPSVTYCCIHEPVVTCEVVISTTVSATFSTSAVSCCSLSVSTYSSSLVPMTSSDGSYTKPLESDMLVPVASVRVPPEPPAVPHPISPRERTIMRAAVIAVILTDLFIIRPPLALYCLYYISRI